MDRILLVRHAEAQGHDGDDPGLSPLGVHQASLLAERLAGQDVAEVLHGPRRRARQTAHQVAQRLGCPLHQTHLLEDRTPYPSAGRWGDYPQHRHAFLHGVPEQERDEDGVALAAAWTRLSAPGSSGVLVAITHAFVVGSFVREVLGAPPAAWMQLPIANASITDLRARENGEWSVAGVSDVGHLRGL